MARKIKGTRILPDGKRQIYVFVEREIEGEKKRFYRTELTESESVKEIRRRRIEMRNELLEKEAVNYHHTKEINEIYEVFRHLPPVRQKEFLSKCHREIISKIECRRAKDFILQIYEMLENV